MPQPLGCGDASPDRSPRRHPRPPTPPPPPPPPPQAALSLALPGVTFQPLLSNEPPLTFFMPAHPGARLEVLGALTGHLTQTDRPQLATFLHLREGSGGQELNPALGLEAGLYMILVGIDRGPPALG